MLQEQKVAVVTGGYSGLGLATVEHLLSLGFRVASLDLSTEAHSLSATQNVNTFRSFNLDVTQADKSERVLSDVMRIFGKVDVCINCAGIAPAQKVLDKAGKAQVLQAFSKAVSVNLIGTFNICRLAAELMQKNKPNPKTGERGLIINTASVAAFEGQKGQCAYAASKGGIVSMTLPMARDLAANGIRVNAIAPGVMSTALMKAMPDKVQVKLCEDVLLPKRMGEPNEFAKLVEHIIFNAYLNAEVIRLDGGLRMH